MKKIFTLSIAIFCIVAINAQITDSRNGFTEMFDYTDGTVADDVTYDDGLTSEWPEGATVMSNALQWDLDAEGEAWLGFGFDPVVDVTGYEVFEYMYQTPAESELCIYMADAVGGEYEICPENQLAGLSELTAASLDLSDAEGLDVSQMIEVGFLIWTPNAGTAYIDDIKLGGATVGISSRSIQNTLQIYPNPASEGFRIDADIKSLSIFNSIGQVVYSTENYVKGSSINVSELDKGLYIVKADDIAKKLMVE